MGSAERAISRWTRQLQYFPDFSRDEDRCLLSSLALMERRLHHTLQDDLCTSKKEIKISASVCIFNATGFSMGYQPIQYLLKKLWAWKNIIYSVPAPSCGAFLFALPFLLCSLFYGLSFHHRYMISGKRSGGAASTGRKSYSWSVSRENRTAYQNHRASIQGYIAQHRYISQR